MSASSSRSFSTVPLWIIAVVALLYFLKAAKTLLIPIALAALVSYALAPVVLWLERHHVPRLAGATLVLFLLAGLSGTSLYLLRSDAMELADVLPAALDRARDRVAAQLEAGARPARQAAMRTATGKLETGGIEQAVETAGEMTSGVVEQGVAAIFGLTGHAVAIFFLTFFMLVSGGHIRNRLVEVSGPDGDRRRTTATIIDSINTQIQGYLLVLLVTAVVVGIATWLVLAWMGVEYAPVWGLLAGLFNSIPYFGPVIVAGGLFVVGMVQGGGIGEALQISGAATVITSLEGWLILPLLVSKAERMSALAVFLGLLLWTWVWGAWGTVLAVPMLVVVKSVADHVDGLKPLGRLMAP